MDKTHDIVVYGDYTQDTIISKGKSSQTLGGPAAYISELFNAMGIDYKIVAKVGKDFVYLDRMHKEPIISGPSTSSTTLIYSGHDRKQTVDSLSEKIGPEDIVDAEIAIINCSLGEITPEAIAEIRKRSRIMICDIQGIVRRIEKNGNISYSNLEETDYFDYIKSADFITTSEKEFNYIRREEISSVVILTQGKNGCTLMEEKKSMVVSTDALEGVDFTGAGDMFLGGFAYALLKGRSLLECAQTANKTGALALREIGVPKLKEEDVSEVL